MADFQQFINPDDTRTLLTRMVRSRSLNPPGDVRECAGIITEELKARGLPAEIIEDKPGGLNRLTQCLYKENININNAYGFVLESWKTAVFVVDVDQIEKTEQVLKREKFKLLDEEALSAIEPFHYSKY